MSVWRGMAAAGLAVVAAATIACGAQAKRSAREFDGQRAFGYLQHQAEAGPRIPGTPPHEQIGDWIAAQLRGTADTLIVQEIPHRPPNGATLTMHNYLARFRPEAAERILFLAHWDTRPMADQSANLAAQRMPVPGANDGASGVAVLLGVADVLKTKPPTVGVDLLFVDGEDFGSFADSTQVLIGSRWFAAHQPAGYPPLYAVLFDMIGDKDLRIGYEGNSQAFAPEVVSLVWRTAANLGYGNVFIPQVESTLTDDHTALQAVGIHAIDVVDFNYGPNNSYWHTTDDTIDKVSANSLQIVGDVAMALVRTAGQ